MLAVKGEAGRGLLLLLYGFCNLFDVALEVADFDVLHKVIELTYEVPLVAEGRLVEFQHHRRIGDGVRSRPLSVQRFKLQQMFGIRNFGRRNSHLLLEQRWTERTEASHPSVDHIGTFFAIQSCHELAK